MTLSPDVLSQGSLDLQPALGSSSPQGIELVLIRAESRTTRTVFTVQLATEGRSDARSLYAFSCAGSSEGRLVSCDRSPMERQDMLYP